MAKRNRRRRHRLLALFAAGTAAVAVALLVAVIVVVVRSPSGTVGPVPPTAAPPTVGPPGSKPRPEFQDASCPDVMLLSIPGTWESWPTDDPLNPTQFPLALLLTVTRPIAEQFGADRVQTYTVPYTAQFHNPFAKDNQIDYDDSRAEGTRAAVKALTDMNNRCPLTSYVIVGFSQGAVIAGDIANSIGNRQGPIDYDLVLGVTAIADGRRQTGVGRDVGPNPPGQGAEVTLHQVPLLSPESGVLSLGLTMTGPRPGGFGVLNDKVYEICATGDLICAAPEEAFDVRNLPRTLDVLIGGAGQPVHALYGTPQFWSVDGLSSNQWTLNWARGLIEAAPQPKHG